MTEPTMSTGADPNRRAESRERSGTAGRGVAGVH